MKNFIKIFILLIFTVASSIFSQERNPYIAYIYPAGGQIGTSFKVIVGGQNLRGANDVYFSKEGLKATVINYQGPSGILTPLQQEELRRRIQEIRDKRAGKKIEEITRTETEKKSHSLIFLSFRTLKIKRPDNSSKFLKNI